MENRENFIFHRLFYVIQIGANGEFLNNEVYGFGGKTLQVMAALTTGAQVRLT